MKKSGSWLHVILMTVLSLGITSTATVDAKPRPKKKPSFAHPKNRHPSTTTYSPLPPDPPPVPARIVELLSQVEDTSVRILNGDFRENRCIPFEGSVVVVEFGRITCRNAIYRFDTDAPQPPYWYETDVQRNTIEVKTLVDYPDKGKGYTITTITLGGSTEERGFFIATKG